MLVCIIMPVISFLLYLHVCCCLLLAFSPSCLSFSAYSSFDSILHRHCISSLSACCCILAQHSFHAFGLLPFRRLFLLVTYACFPLNTRLGPYILLIFFTLFCGSLPNSVIIHMAPLCKHLMAQNNFCTSA